MDQSVEHTAEDALAVSGDDDVSGMSVITVESASAASVHSVDSSAGELDDLMIDLDNDEDDDDMRGDDDESESCENEIESPVLDAVQCDNGDNDTVDKESIPLASESVCTSNAEFDVSSSQCNSMCETAPVEIAAESDASDGIHSSTPIVGEKFDETITNGKKLSSEHISSAGGEKIHATMSSKRNNKKTLNELHKELLKKAVCLNMAEEPGQQAVNSENSNDIYCSGNGTTAVEVFPHAGADESLDRDNNVGSLAASSTVLSEHEALKCERSKSRKAAKPVKRGPDLITEFVEIRPAKNLLATCGWCSYTCSSNKQLDFHGTEVHRSTEDADRSICPYGCPLCSWYGSAKESLERHVAHHPGQHFVRYHTCPYCLFTSTEMSAVELHLSFSHPTDAFRFEVLQECISYKQKLVECPICQGLYQWQQDLLSHFREYHSLESLASYIESAFPDQSEASRMSVPKELFNDLLDRYAAGVDVEDADDGRVGIESVEENDSTPWTVNMVATTQNLLSPDLGTVVRFFCSNCDFNCDDFELFRKHCAIHTAVVVSASRGNTSPTTLAKIRSGYRNTFHCHLCPFECSKMVHYRRHLEIHERNQSLAEGFRCGYCHFAHYRQNCVKFHLGKYHGDRPIKMSRITDGVEVELSETDLFALRSRRTPSDGRKSVSSSLSSSVLVLRSKNEKRPTSRYKSEESIPLLASENTSGTAMKSSPLSLVLNGSGTDKLPKGSLAGLEESNRLLEEFEQSLSGSMIYPDPVKCPRCDFTNRVRVNMIRHLKLHRDEDSALFGMVSLPVANEMTLDNEQPLLRQILSEKPQVCKAEATNHFDDTADGDASLLKAGVTEDKVAQSAPQDYSEFCYKLPNSDLFQCHRCHFTHRFPSKVKRHYHYRHSSVAPYKCGHCRFEAVERGKVVKHWQVMHRSLPMLVIQQDSGITADAASTPVPVDNCDFGTNSNSRVDSSSELPEMNLSAIVKEELVDYDCEAPALDYYPINEYSALAGDGVNSTASPVDSQSPILTRSRSSLEFESSVDQLTSSRGSRMCRRQFQCAYCGVVSRWNRRDICLHVMHVHLQRRVFTCRHCSFGNSKSKMLVRAHCVKFHPNRVVSVRDDSSIANAITAVEEKDGIVTVAFAPNGSPIMDTDGLQEYLAKNKLTPMPLSVNKKKPAVPPSEPKNSVPSLPVSSGHNFNLRLRTAQKEPANDKPAAVSEATVFVTPSVSSSKARWKCRLCGFANERIGRVKYHIICRHLNLKPFSCPHCHLYLWKIHAVESHIDRCHPGMERRVMATVDEMASYLRRNVEQSAGSSESSRKVPMPSSVPATTSVISLSSNKPTYFRCKLCGFQDVRNDKTKYHIVKQHLKLRQFSCPYCHLYLWGRQQVARHVEEKHPGLEVRIQRTFQEYEQFLRNNVCKVEVATNSPAAAQSGPLSPSASVTDDELLQRSTTLVARLPCDLCSFVTDSEMSLSAHRRSHRLYQCMHCRFRHTLVAKVQSHCLSMHPTLPVQYKQWTPSALSCANASHQNSSVDLTDDVGNCLKFYPCDFCPSHFGTQSALDGHLNLVHGRVHSCQLCGLTSLSRDDLEIHSQEEHAGEPVSLAVVPSDTADNRGSSKKSGVKRPAGSDDDDGETDQERAKRQKPDTSAASDSTSSLYKCRLCPYSCYKVTVMRHHVMSHLRYHPYICPYCNVLRSVKSFPVKKHIRLKHRGEEERFLFVQNKVLEAKVEKSFYHIPAKLAAVNGSWDNNMGVKNSVDNNSEGEPPRLERQVEPVKLMIGLSSPQIGQHKVLYRCMMCGLKTHIRMDMRHHLMREIQYKPFKCVHCPYTEPCRWSMRKHFRTKHIGLDVAVTDMRDPVQDERIERMLEECTIPLKDTNDYDLRAWKSRALSPQHAMASRSNDNSSSVSLDHSAVDVDESASLVGAISPSSVALKLHRCPHCLYTNSNLKLLRSHMVKHGPHRLQCAYCDHKGHYPSRIYKHIRRHHPGRPFRVVKVPGVEEPKVAPRVDVQPRPHKPSKPSPGQVFLDGVALDISLSADEGGWFRCHECGYQSMNREHYKMHVVIHRPPKWQCFYCDQKYPLIFRLRRHSNQKHPHVSIKWIDLSTGEVCFDPQKMPSAAGDSNGEVVTSSTFPAPVRQQTARKSTTGRRMMQVALFRSGKFGSQRQTSSAGDGQGDDAGSEENGGEKVNGDDEIEIADDDDVERSENSSEDDDVNSISAVYIDYDEDVSNGTYVHSNILRFSCHLCSFSVRAMSPSALAEHMNREHYSDLCRLPAVEILDFDVDTDVDGSASVTLLRRCGFCPFESYVGSEFDEHMRSAHDLSHPLRCNLGCMYATFSRLRMHAHFAETHPHKAISISPLNKPYSMLPYEEESVEENDDIFVTFSAKVVLDDVFEWSDDKFDGLLATHGVWY